MNEMQGVLWKNETAGHRVTVRDVKPLAVAITQVMNEMWPGCGSCFIREQLRVIWGERFANHGGMCGLISRLLENPQDYPSRHRAEVERLRPQVAKLVRSNLKAPLAVAGKIANE